MMTRLGVLHSQRAQSRARGRPRREATAANNQIEIRGRHGVCASGKASRSAALGDSHAAIDAGGGGWWLLVHLEADIFEQGGFGQGFFGYGGGVFHRGPPTQEMEQIVGVAAQSAVPRRHGLSADPGGG